ncbi:MAG: ThiF family adenylyltransferase [Methanomassiliicoccus sp.]|nr:ThiF family adenylyltransferase [Methanomassiliicoccus sp.]
MTIIRTGEEDADRWDRSRRIDWLDMGRVQAARFLVLGAGALGNEVVKDLVLAGAREITVVDMDRVVRSNLSRCVLFRERDSAEHRWKVEAVAERARDLDPEVRVRAVAGRIEQLEEREWKDSDIVLGCLDNIAARLHANAHSYHHGTPYIDGGTDGFSGRVQVIVPPSTPCLQCGLNQSHYRILEKRYSCTGADVTYYEPSMAAEITTTSIVAAVQVREALKIVSGRSDAAVRNVIHYNGLRNTWDELEMSFEPACPLHQDRT